MTQPERSDMAYLIGASLVVFTLIVVMVFAR